MEIIANFLSYVSYSVTFSILHQVSFFHSFLFLSLTALFTKMMIEAFLLSLLFSQAFWGNFFSILIYVFFSETTPTSILYFLIFFDLLLFFVIMASLSSPLFVAICFLELYFSIILDISLHSAFRFLTVASLSSPSRLHLFTFTYFSLINSCSVVAIAHHHL